MADGRKYKPLFAFTVLGQASAQLLTAELLRCGVSGEGARQFVTGAAVSGLGDRKRLAQIVGQELGLMAGENTSAVPLLLPAVQKIRDAAARVKVPPGLNLTAMGAQQFFSFQLVTDANDRQFLTAILGAALESRASRRLKYNDVVLKKG